MNLRQYLSEITDEIHHSLPGYLRATLNVSKPHPGDKKTPITRKERRLAAEVVAEHKNDNA